MTEQERPEKRYPDFEFSLRELAGSMGDFGTLFHLALGYIAIIAPAGLICDYFARREVSERKLLFNMGIMNAVGCLFGGIPVCHGAGGLAGQYYFSARTGGAAIRCRAVFERGHRGHPGSVPAAADRRYAVYGGHRAGQTRPGIEGLEIYPCGRHSRAFRYHEYGHRLRHRAGGCAPAESAAEKRILI